MIDSIKLIPEYAYRFKYSVCTFVTRKNEYQLMKNSFLERGFDSSTTEYLYFDNSENSQDVDAYVGINHFLQKAKGEYIIICHQDIILIDNLLDLNNCITQVKNLDVNWAILSNAGGYGPNKTCWYISYPETGFESEGNFPSKIHAADENFILIKSSANLCLSKDLYGFHFYGADLCMISDLLGYSNWAIPFNVLHKSKGSKDESFWKLKKLFKIKYSKFFKSRWIQTTTSPVYLTANSFDKIFIGSRLILKIQKFFQ